jgi:hypothetical protein
MTNPTSNFGWQMPTNTDLVTDLPADFAVFGQAVDTSMADLLGGTTGQILAKNSNTNMDFVWVANDVGDITAVNVTSPITGGGSSGAVTVGIQSASTSQSGAVQLSDSTSTTSSILAATPTAVKSSYDLAAAATTKATLTTKGDIYAATAASTPARLAVGSNYEVLSAQSGQTTGLQWVGNITAFTPSWSSTGTAPSLGNGQLAMYYQRYGKMCFVRMYFQVGSTSTFGTGTYLFSLPFTPTNAGVCGIPGNAYVEDFAVAGYRAQFSLSSTSLFLVQSGGNNSISNTVPFTWGTNDYISGQFVYEVA